MEHVYIYNKYTKSIYIFSAIILRAAIQCHFLNIFIVQSCLKYWDSNNSRIVKRSKKLMIRKY